MCDCIENEDERDLGPAVDPDDLMARTREIEARKPGGRVPEALWPVFFGLRSGSIPGHHLQRMLASRATALAFLTARAASHRTRSGLGHIQCSSEQIGASRRPE
jgi:hypothetical protein